MKKSYIIMGILICIIAFLGYLQYGHEEQAFVLLFLVF